MRWATACMSPPTHLVMPPATGRPTAGPAPTPAQSHQQVWRGHNAPQRPASQAGRFSGAAGEMPGSSVGKGRQGCSEASSDRPPCGPDLPKAECTEGKWARAPFWRPRHSVGSGCRGVPGLACAWRQPDQAWHLGGRETAFTEHALHAKGEARHPTYSVLTKARGRWPEVTEPARGGQPTHLPT